MATLVCRVQLLDDTDPFNSTNFPEPTRPPLYTFREDIPLATQLAGVHRLLRAPQKVRGKGGLGACVRGGREPGEGQRPARGSPAAGKTAGGPQALRGGSPGSAPGGGAARPGSLLPRRATPRPGSIGISLSPGERPEGHTPEGLPRCSGGFLIAFKGCCRLCVSCSCCRFSSRRGNPPPPQTKARAGYQMLNACPLLVTSRYLEVLRNNALRTAELRGQAGIPALLW